MRAEEEEAVEGDEGAGVAIHQVAGEIGVLAAAGEKTRRLESKKVRT